MRVLVTRPTGDAEETAARLIALGHELVKAPLLEIKFRAGGEIVLDGVQAILITSANAVRALAQRTARRDLRVLAVGEQSAETAHALGFRNVDHAGGDAVALANLAVATLSPKGGALVHISGSETRGNLAEKLAASGFALRSEIIYDALAAETLSAEVQAALAQGKLAGALFYSPRTARIFVDLVSKLKLENACAALDAFCISQATASELRGLAFRNIRVAAEPNQDALLALLR
jgi:uroporphyrinogen-III synthase